MKTQLSSKFAEVDMHKNNKMKASGEERKLRLSLIEAVVGK